MKQIDRLSNELVNTLSKQRDEIIAKAINSIIGDNWCADDLIGRGEFITLNDGSDLFMFDGKPLINFMKPKSEFDGFNFKSIQEYKILY